MVRQGLGQVERCGELPREAAGSSFPGTRMALWGNYTTLVLVNSMVLWMFMGHTTVVDGCLSWIFHEPNL